jgi:hypothetical protein
VIGAGTSTTWIPRNLATTRNSIKRFEIDRRSALICQPYHAIGTHNQAAQDVIDSAPPLTHFNRPVLSPVFHPSLAICLGEPKVDVISHWLRCAKRGAWAGEFAVVCT